MKISDAHPLSRHKSAVYTLYRVLSSPNSIQLSLGIRDDGEIFWFISIRVVFLRLPDLWVDIQIKEVAMLIGGKVRLRKVEREDLGFLFDLVNDTGLQNYDASMHAAVSRYSLERDFESLLQDVMEVATDVVRRLAVVQQIRDAKQCVVNVDHGQAIQLLDNDLQLVHRTYGGPNSQVRQIQPNPINV